MAEPVLFTNYITGTFSDTFYEGGGLLEDVPSTWDVALNGRKYMIDWTHAHGGDMSHRSTRMLRWQADASNEPGEESLNYDDLWRRSTSSWNHGAGQKYLDKGTQSISSDRLRYNQSKGINPWIPFRLSLHNDVRAAATSGNTTILLTVVGSRLYLVDKNVLSYTTDITPGTPTFTTVTGYSGGDIKSICSDGFNVYFTDGTDVWTTTRTSAGATKYITGFAVDLVGFVKGRLMAAKGAALYNIITNAAPAALFTHPNSDFGWVGFADGMNAIYCAGYSGASSSVYRIGIRTDATSLDQPILATPGMPTGEIISAIYGYLGYILIGSQKGFRFCIPDASGALKVGAATPSPDASVQIGTAPVAFYGNDRFCYFGWTNYDALSTGVGRVDITAFGDVDKQQLAYASDLMFTGQGAVTSIASFQNLMLFAVAGHGVYVQDTANLVASGTLDSGIMDFQLTDPKVALKATMTFTSGFAGSVKGYIATDESSSFALIGTQLDTDPDLTGASFPIGALRAKKFEVRFELDRSASVASTGPTMSHWTLRVQPAPDLTEVLTVPLIINKDITNGDGGEETMDPVMELAFLKELHTTRDVYVYQEGNTLYTVVLDEYEWKPEGFTGPRSGDNSGLVGTFVATQKAIST